MVVGLVCPPIPMFPFDSISIIFEKVDPPAAVEHCKPKLPAATLLLRNLQFLSLPELLGFDRTSVPS